MTPARRRPFLLVLSLVALALLVACEAGNPLLGTWTVDPAKSPEGSVTGLEMSGSTDLEFLEARMIAGASSLDVTYVVEPDRVTVTTLQGQGTVYQIRSQNEMSVQTPMGPIVFRRVE